MSQTGSPESPRKHLLPEQDAPKSLPNEPSAYQSSFALKNGKKESVPIWVPLTLIAFSTAALVVPIVLFRRQRAALLEQSLAKPPPPPRRTNVGVTPPARTTLLGSAPPPRRSTTPSAALPSSVPSSADTAKLETEAAGDYFNGVLYSAKAFVIATTLVGVGAVATVWGVKTALGVRDTQEFAQRMRLLIMDSMPNLSARIHQALHDEEERAFPSEAITHTITNENMDANSKASIEWSWPDAETRLKAAFEKDGLVGWGEAVLHELETEAKINRSKRGHA
ncbi:uncharacterized protein LAESUDRAFT_697949 [Laetiporus sulphureus 93-53]|uniref:Altered inheritance of mitochondria protein 11 n=1 Tax=Laetiporus sulphureus 93-53 TaxID=1314785 RepID=A0A165EX31_9APHY|nr:uncharacterized protein LAESUDRAFT_697949 [Laetiporus sulphureus 93-53]KZT07910.1 hypothetical protein LAESUDRAFT_697949 [Laetiporus sulphureus 93-53]